MKDEEREEFKRKFIEERMKEAREEALKHPIDEETSNLFDSFWKNLRNDGGKKFIDGPLSFEETWKIFLKGIGAPDEIINEKITEEDMKLIDQSRKEFLNQLKKNLKNLGLE